MGLVFMRGFVLMMYQFLICRDHAVGEGLEYVATWNSAQLLSEDLHEAFAALMAKRKPTYSKM
jgi:hypothetical protein